MMALGTVSPPEASRLLEPRPSSSRAGSGLSRPVLDHGRERVRHHGPRPRPDAPTQGTRTPATAGRGRARAGRQRLPSAGGMGRGYHCRTPAVAAQHGGSDPMTGTALCSDYLGANRRGPSTRRSVAGVAGHCRSSGARGRAGHPQAAGEAKRALDRPRGSSWPTPSGAGRGPRRRMHRPQRRRDAFCAGMDVTEFGAMPTTSAGGRDLDRSLEALGSCPRPVIAAVNGPALAGGFALALLCDIRIAATSRDLRFPGAAAQDPPSYASARAALGPGQARRSHSAVAPSDPRRRWPWGSSTRSSPMARLLRALAGMAAGIAAAPRRRPWRPSEDPARPGAGLRPALRRGGRRLPRDAPRLRAGRRCLTA